jgi:hypothetical protein
MNDIEKAIEVLKMENGLMQFDPMTGEIEPIELQNEMNRDLFEANLMAIEALEQQERLKRYLKQLKERYHKYDSMLIQEVIDIVDDCIVEVDNILKRK